MEVATDNSTLHMYDKSLHTTNNYVPDQAKAVRPRTRKPSHNIETWNLAATGDTYGTKISCVNDKG